MMGSTVARRARLGCAGAVALVAAGCFAPVTMSAQTITHADTVTISGEGCTELDPWTGSTFVQFRLDQIGLDRSLSNWSVIPDEDGRWTTTLDLRGTYLGPPASAYRVTARCNNDNDPYPGGEFVLLPGDAPQIDGTLALNRTQVQAGGTVAITGDRFLSSMMAGVFLYPSQQHLVNIRPGSGEVLRGDVTIPADTPPGTYTIVAEGLGPPGGGLDPNTTGPRWTYAAEITVVAGG